MKKIAVLESLLKNKAKSKHHDSLFNVNELSPRSVGFEVEEHVISDHLNQPSFRSNKMRKSSNSSRRTLDNFEQKYNDRKLNNYLVSN